MVDFRALVSRRKFASWIATGAALAVVSNPVLASIPAGARALTRQEEYDQFEAAMKLAFNPVAYVNYVSVTNDCFAIYRGEKRMMYKCWLSQFDQRNNCDRFLAELERRGWSYQMLPGENYWEAERRVEALRKRERIGVYAMASKAEMEGPLRADDVTGTTAFADWQRRRENSSR